MVVTTRVDMDGDRPVVVKRAAGPAADRLRREAERLARASHPGVVTIVRSGAAGDGWELCTLHGGRPVAAIGALTVAQVAGLAAGVASTLADLHDLGVVHGRIDGSHILVGEQGRTVLCGFGDDEPPARPEDDVAAVGALLVELLGTEEGAEPTPDRRWWGRRAWGGWDRRTLLLLADQAAADPPSRRPSARRLAAAIAAAVPGTARIEEPPLATATLDAPIDGDPIERLRSSAVVDPPRASAPARAVVAVAVVAVVVAVVGARRVADDPSRPPSAVAVASSSTTVAPPVEERTAIPVPGTALEAAGRRYRVGQDGDELLVADWDCDGESTPALLRPGTGEVFVFPRWIEEGTLAVEPLVRVSGAHALVSQQVEGGCPTLAVRTAANDLVPVIEAAR